MNIACCSYKWTHLWSNWDSWVLYFLFSVTNVMLLPKLEVLHVQITHGQLWLLKKGGKAVFSWNCAYVIWVAAFNTQVLVENGTNKDHSVTVWMSADASSENRGEQLTWDWKSKPSVFFSVLIAKNATWDQFLHTKLPFLERHKKKPSCNITS